MAVCTLVSGQIQIASCVLPLNPQLPHTSTLSSFLMKFNSQIGPGNPLLVDELLHNVLEYLATGGGKEQRFALAALARTCRALSEPSLDYLWRRLDSLMPLFRCFSNVVDEARVKVLLSPSEWLVINRYSPRIQELTLGSENLSLYFLHFTELVLPNLRVLRWKSFSTCSTLTAEWIRFPFNSFAFLRPLLTPKLTTMEVTLADGNDLKLRQFLQNYSHLCPNLRSIKFDFLWETLPPAIMTRALSQAICRHADLQRVELSIPLDNLALKHLGMSSALETVSLALVSNTSEPEETCFAPDDTPFCSVVHLALKLWSPLESVTDLLRPREQPFRSFKVVLHKKTTTPTLFALFAALASPQRVHSLQSIIIQEAPAIFGAKPPNRTQGRPVHLSYETFSPLVSLVHLRELSIDLSHRIAFDDGEFASLVSNWPLLEVLQVMCLGAPSEDSTESITLNALLSILSSCRNLRDIGLSLDARNVPAEMDVDLCRPSVANLTLRNSSIKLPDLVADFLLRYMPSVRFMATFTWWRFPANPVDPRKEYQQLWSEVAQHIATKRRPDSLMR